MDMQLLLLCQSNTLKKAANVCSLISLQLYDLSILFIFDDSSIAGKFLQTNET